MSSASDNTEEYNGTSWSDGENMLAGKRSHAVAGTQTAALAAGGEGTLTDCQEYNGTCWVAGGNMTGSGKFQHGAFGTLTTAIAMGGSGYLATAEQYDGDTWSAIDSMPAGKSVFASFGTAGTGIIGAGRVTGGGATTNTYKYGVTARTVTDS